MGFFAEDFLQDSDNVGALILVYSQLMQATAGVCLFTHFLSFSSREPNSIKLSGRVVKPAILDSTES